MNLNPNICIVKSKTGRSIFTQTIRRRIDGAEKRWKKVIILAVKIKKLMSGKFVIIEVLGILLHFFIDSPFNALGLIRTDLRVDY